MDPLTATIEVPAGQTDTAEFLVTLRITNQSDRTVAVLNPSMGIPAPTMKWPWSNETYQTSMLMSFGYLSMSVTDETGQELPQQAIQTWATPVLRPKIELGHGDSFELAIPIGSFYQLASGRAYLVVLEYGDQDLKVVARTSVTAP
jgi:hypothetical protein